MATSNQPIGFWALLREDLSVPIGRDPAIKSRWELLFNYPGVWAVLWHRLAHALCRRGWQLPARWVAGIAEGLSGVDIHPAATIGRRLFIDHGIGVVIGATAVIGDDVTIYQQVTLGGVSLNQGKRHPTIGDNVVIGAGARVLGDILIGNGAKIGANSVVVKAVPAGCTAVGIPARITGNEPTGPLDHHRLPDLQKEMFVYLMKRIKILEESLSGCKDDFSEKDRELDRLFEHLIASMEK